MDNHEVSAFAAYSAEKKPKKLNVNKKLKIKKKHKKMKLNNDTVTSVMNTLINATNFSPAENINGKNKKKHAEKKNLIKSILRAQKESIFKDCTVTNKAENVFFREIGLIKKNANNESGKNTNNESGKNSDEINRSKKLKKKKLSNNKLMSDKDDIKNISKNNKSTVSVHDTEAESKYNSEEIDTVPPKPNKKRKLKKLEDGQKDKNLNNSDSVKIVEAKEKQENMIYCDSVKVGEEVFSWLLNPISLNEFFECFWEQTPLYIEHKEKNYFKCICTLEDFKSALRENDMYFTRNIDVTSYIDGVRYTENLEGKAKPALVWDFFKNGRSIRLLNPQTFISSVRVLNSALQEFFHCFVGANIYLTPPGTQGFAPHYDDIEAFVLQLEGEKLWKLYDPRSSKEVLPRESSRNFKEDEIGDPILEVTLQPGDLLYFPRGIIHQAKCLPHVHSLHITVSCYQKNSWADLLEKVLPVALQKAINEDIEFRKGLPIGYLNSLGMVYSDRESVQRQEIILKFEKLARKVIDHCLLDAGVDQLGANYTHDALPPSLSETEKLYGADRNCKIEDKNVWNILKNSFDKNLKVKLIRATSVRLVSEEEEMVLYYTTDNSLVYHEFEASRVIISAQWAQAIEYLIHSYPEFAEMKELPVSIKVNKPGKWKRIIDFVYFLWQKGLLLFDQPLLEICS